MIFSLHPPPPLFPLSSHFLLPSFWSSCFLQCLQTFFPFPHAVPSGSLSTACHTQPCFSVSPSHSLYPCSPYTHIPLELPQLDRNPAHKTKEEHRRARSSHRLNGEQICREASAPVVFFYSYILTVPLLFYLESTSPATQTKDYADYHKHKEKKIIFTKYPKM